MSEQGYNGWSNYPTWNVNLWLSNDEGLYNETRRRLRCLTRYERADALKTFVRDELAPDLGASFAADLMGYALDEVDWFEIAEAWSEDAAPDFTIDDHGSLVLLHPKTEQAREWVSEHLPDDAQRFGGAVVVEPRYIEDIIAGIRDDGLAVAV